MNIARWSLFSWGSLACGAMLYFATRWIVEPPNPLHNELLIGVAMALVFGLPAFLVLPFLAYLGRPLLEAKRKLLLLAPSIGAAITMSVIWALGGA